MASEQSFDETALRARMQDMLRQEPTMGYRTMHTKLKEEAAFAGVSLKKVQAMLGDVKAALEAAAQGRAGSAGPGENIWTAAGDGDMNRVEALLDLEGFLPTSPDENGYTPIHAATAWGHVDLLRRLLTRVKEPHGEAAAKLAANVEDSDGDTPLHHLAGANELDGPVIAEVVRILLEFGADPSRKNSEGQTCLEASCTGLEGEGEEDEERMDDDEQVQVNIEFVKALAEHGYSLDSELPGGAGSTQGCKMSVNMDELMAEDGDNGDAAA